MISVYILSSFPGLAPSLLLTDNDLVCYTFEVTSDLNTVKSNCLLSVANSLSQQQLTQLIVLKFVFHLAEAQSTTLLSLSCFSFLLVALSWCYLFL